MPDAYSGVIPPYDLPPDDEPEPEPEPEPDAIDWYDTEHPSVRRRALTLWPSGELTAAERETPGDVWGPPRTLGQGVTLVDAQAEADARGLVWGDASPTATAMRPWRADPATVARYRAALDANDYPARTGILLALVRMVATSTDDTASIAAATARAILVLERERRVVGAEAVTS